jgi:acid phosphatase (class A)
MGGGWQGGGWQGGGWQGGGWQGGGWQGGGWQGGGGFPSFAMRADRPLADLPIASDLTATHPGFPRRHWDPDLWSLNVLTQFFDPALNWATRVVVAAPLPITQNDVDRLLILAVTERPEAMGEIIQQHQNFQLCWLQLLMIDASTHPNTFLLMKLAARVGETLMIHFKRKYDRPRPSQVCPTLYPPVPVPGHGSYPAGHAMIARLTTLVLKDVIKPLPKYQGTHAALDELANRVGYNRVIAGLHWESDIRAGMDTADQIFEVLKDCQDYQDVVAEIEDREEW